MIKIQITKSKDKYQSIISSGHANFADYGQDLVCAAITGIISGAMNAFDSNYKNDVEIKVEENLVSIKLKDLNNNDLQTMFKMLEIQIKTIEIQYPKNIKLEEVF